MRMLSLCLMLALVAFADEAKKKIEAVSEEAAKTAIKEFDDAFRTTKDVEAKQNAVYNLHDVPHPLVVRKLEKILKNKDPKIRNVAALALGGQGHDVEGTGALLMRIYKKDYKQEMVLASVLEGVAELRYLKYWPEVKKSLRDERSAIVIRTLDLLASNKDFRAIPTLLEMYKIAMPKRVSWKTGSVTVDTGAAGDADQKAAEAAFNKKYGRGGSKMKAKAKAKARAFDERNFATQLRKVVKAITGEDFDNSIDFEDWYVDNYVMVHRRIAEMEGTDPDAAERKAKAELPDLKAKVEEERKKLEEQLKKEEEEAAKKQKK